MSSRTEIQRIFDKVTEPEVREVSDHRIVHARALEVNLDDKLKTIVEASKSTGSRDDRDRKSYSINHQKILQRALQMSSRKLLDSKRSSVRKESDFARETIIYTDNSPSVMELHEDRSSIKQSELDEAYNGK